MKKIPIICLAAFLAVSFVCVTACVSKSGDKASGVTCRLLTDSTGIDDKSYNQAAWRGILEFYGDTWGNTKLRGISYDVIAAQSQDLYIPVLRQATDEGYDLIVSTGFTWAQALEQVANDNPDQKYMMVDIAGINASNVMKATYAEHEGSFLVGVAAALKAQEDGIQNPRFGFIGGYPGAVITKFEVGYVQGILSIIPDAQIVDYYVSSWSDTALAKTQAKNWYDSGVYAIYTAAGSSGNGTIAQAKEYRAAGRNVWAIGVDSDQYEEGLYNDQDSAVLTSMLKQVETSLVYALNAVQNDTFTGEVIVFDLTAGGVGYSTTNDALGMEIIAQLEEIKQDIINGSIKVSASYADAQLIPGFPRNLRAQDD